MTWVEWNDFTERHPRVIWHLAQSPGSGGDCLFTAYVGQGDVTFLEGARRHWGKQGKKL